MLNNPSMYYFAAELEDLGYLPEHTKEAIDPRLTMWLLKKQKKVKSPAIKKMLGSAAKASSNAMDASIDMYADAPTTRAGRMLKASKKAVQDINDGTNPAMATTHAKLRFAADSGIGQGIEEAGKSVAKGGKLMAESSDSIPRKAVGRALQAAGNVTTGAGWTTKNLPDWMPGWAPV